MSATTGHPDRHHGRRRGVRGSGEAGSMAVEVVVLVPILLLVLLLVVAFGRVVSAQGEAASAAREAARAASLERDAANANAAVLAAVARNVPDHLQCDAPIMSGPFVAGGVVTVDLRCRVALADLGLPGLGGSVAVGGRSSAPLDEFRRTG